MNIIYKAEYKRDFILENGKSVEVSTKFSSNKPSELLETLCFYAGTKYMPSLEHLLHHLYEKQAAYCGRNFTITIAFEE